MTTQQGKDLLENIIATYHKRALKAPPDAIEQGFSSADASAVGSELLKRFSLEGTRHLLLVTSHMPPSALASLLASYTLHGSSSPQNVTDSSTRATEVTLSALVGKTIEASPVIPIFMWGQLLGFMASSRTVIQVLHGPSSDETAIARPLSSVSTSSSLQFACAIPAFRASVARDGGGRREDATNDALGGKTTVSSRLQCPSTHSINSGICLVSTSASMIAWQEFSRQVITKYSLPDFVNSELVSVIMDKLSVNAVHHPIISHQDKEVGDSMSKQGTYFPLLCFCDPKYADLHLARGGQAHLALSKALPIIVSLGHIARLMRLTAASISHSFTYDRWRRKTSSNLSSVLHGALGKDEGIGKGDYIHYLHCSLLSRFYGHTDNQRQRGGVESILCIKERLCYKRANHCETFQNSFSYKFSASAGSRQT